MTHEYYIRVIARELLAESREPDPLALSHKLMMRLSTDQRDRAVLWYCRAVLEEETIRARDTTSSPAQRGRTRWHVARDEKDSRGWTFLDDCTFDDLIAIAEKFEAQGRAKFARAAELREEAARLRSSGFETLGEMRAALAVAA